MARDLARDVAAEHQASGQLKKQHTAVGELSSGGRLCLDFVDTVDWRLRERPVEFLHTYADLILWARHQDAIYGGVLSRSEAEALLRRADEDRQAAGRALEQARALREALYRVFRAVALKTSPPETDISALNHSLSRALAHSRIVEREQRFAWGWTDDAALDRLLRPVVRSAAELLTEGDLSRLRECEGEGCGWLLYDDSKNRSRRWCTMNGCGNRAKARRHYQRKRAGASASA